MSKVTHETGTLKSWQCTNANGIVRVNVRDTAVELVIVYDDGDVYKQSVDLPHVYTGYPAHRGKWSFQTKVIPK